MSTALWLFWIFGLVLLPLLLLLFPDGRPPSPRWRPVLWMGLGGAIATYVLFLVKPRPMSVTGATATFPNPFAIPGLSDVTGPALVAASWVTVVGVVGCFAASIQRFRHGGTLSSASRSDGSGCWRRSASRAS